MQMGHFFEKEGPLRVFIPNIVDGGKRRYNVADYMENNTPNNGDKGKRVSMHILATSSNMLGICFILISILKYLKVAKSFSHLVDKMVVVPIILFLAASLFSYASMRSRKNELRFEKIADIIFMSALVVVTAISLMVSFEIL